MGVQVTLIVGQPASAMIKKRHAHDSQEGGRGIENGWGGGRGARKGRKADRSWMLLSGGGVLGNGYIVAIVMQMGSTRFSV